MAVRLGRIESGAYVIEAQPHRAGDGTHCDPEGGCITCGDTALPLRVIALDAERELALGADGDGRRETVEIALVQPVAVGDEVLVHAGTAIAKVKRGADRNTPGREAEEVSR